MVCFVIEELINQIQPGYWTMAHFTGTQLGWPTPQLGSPTKDLWSTVSCRDGGTGIGATGRLNPSRFQETSRNHEKTLIFASWNSQILWLQKKKNKMENTSIVGSYTQSFVLTSRCSSPISVWGWCQSMKSWGNSGGPMVFRDIPRRFRPTFSMLQNFMVDRCLSSLLHPGPPKDLGPITP